MACTQQCATDYLRNARQVLIRHLQNFPLITENLYQRKVFNEHEVDALQAEKTDFNRARFILDYVTNKGELACYELLKILDITRERTLHPDSHHWISCFPFSEDADIDYIVGTKPCLSYQKQLEAKAKSISGRRWDQCCKRLQDKTRVHVTFIPLVLDTDADLNSAQNKIKIKNRKCKKCRPKKLKSFIPVQTHKLSPEDLLCSHEKEILVIGKPGIGKTAVVLQMLSLWSSKDSRKLDYMFYFDESTFTTISNLISLESLLFDMYLKPLEKNRKEVLQDIEENSENVIIMFDGISTLEHNPITKKIIERDLLPEAKIVITCRSEEEDEFLFSHRHPCRVYVKGFSEESIRTYLTQMIGSTPELLNIVLNNQDLISLCHVPMYAFMVVYCISFSVTAHKHPITVTEMYVHILRQDLKKAGRKNAEQVDKYINDVKGQLFLLMKTAFAATMQKIVNIKDAVSNEIEITQCFLRKITIQNTPTSVNSFYAFLHSTVQEFFSALWLLGNPGEIDEVLQNCLTKEQKHMKHVIPFLCGLLSEQNLKLLKNLFTEDQIRRASDGMFTKVLNTFLQPQPNGQLGGDDDEVSVLLFVCQCLYESQSPEACLLFLEKMNYDLDLSGEDLDPHQCCAVSYVISQSREKQVHLSLEDCSVSDTGIQMILRFKSHFRDKPSTLCHVWRSVLCCEKPRDFTALLDICGKEMHLPVPGEASIFLKAEEVMSQGSEKISLHLHCTEDTQRFSDDLCNVVVKALPYVKSLSFSAPSYMEVSSSRLKMKSILKICVHAALYKKENIQVVVPKVAVLSEHDSKDFLMDLYSYVKDYEAQTGSSVFPVLQPLYRSFPVWYTMSNVWSINLMERKASHFLEALKVQTAKKPVNVWGWSDEESEVRSFLQCLPYISQLRVLWTGFYEEENKMCAIQFLLKLIVTAAECDAATGESFTKLLTSVCSYTNFPFGDDVSIKSSQCDFLLDLCSHVKDYETQTGRSVLPALQSVYQSAPAVWNIDLSERKTSLFQEVLKLQTVKKPVKLRGWSDEESEVRSFLQCLPYISQLRFYYDEVKGRSAVKFLLKLIVTAAECDAATGESFTKLLTSVCSYKTFPLYDDDYNYLKVHICDFLLDLYSRVKDYETQTGRSVLPALQPVYQSAPAVWYIDLSEIKTSLFLEVLKLQTVKKPVELRGWSDEEIEVRSFLQCLPYISQLRFLSLHNRSESCKNKKRLFLLNLSLQAAVHQRYTVKRTIEELMSHTEDKEDFLLDLCSRVKDYETQTGRSVLPALQPVYQSAPAVWHIDLSERKTSLFLEVLKLQTVKKPVKLRGWSDEESEVRSFLQCLPYISHLSFVSPQNQTESYKNKKRLFLLKLSLQAAVHQRDTVKRTIEELMSHTEDKEYFLLDLYSRVKDYETQTGRSVLPALQPVYQSAPAVWHIDLSERKTPLFLEVLKIQTVKKPVELRGWSDEESEVRSFLQCLPYISQLRFEYYVLYSKVKRRSAVEFLLKLIVTAAECDAATGETFTKLLTSVCSYTNFPVDGINYQCDFLLDLYSRVKDYETQTGRSVLPALQPVYQSAPAVWNIDLSERKTSLFLEVLKLHTVKKPVELRGWSDEESEVRSFLQCLPYISQLRFEYDVLYSKVKRRYAVEFLLKLIVTAAECDAATGESFTKLLTSVCSYTNFPIDGINYQCDFLLDLSSRVKDYETQTGRSVLPALQPVYQSAPAVWYIDLSERKTSLFLEVLKLQTVKKPVKLWGWSDEESEVRSFLQCLPYISHLKFNYVLRNKEQRRSAVEFLLKLIVTAAECDAATGESFTKLLTSVCSYTNFPVDGINYQCDFLLDLCSRVKDYETQTGRSVLPALQPVYQSAPAVWNIDLSERKTSLFLEVLKLHTVKKPVELRGWSDEESEVRSFLQCLPYISQLRFEYFVFYYEEQRRSAVEFLLNLTVTASECDAATGESFTKLLTSVCSYTNFPVDGINYQCDFLLDLYSRVKDYETQTGRNVLPALQPIYQSAPAVWNIDLSERKTSIFLEVLKLHTVKKPVELRGWSDEESELRSFLQCLPYISHLRFLSLQNQTESYKNKKRLFLLNLSLQAAVHQRDTVKRTIEELMSHTEDKEDFLLDLYSRVKDYETQTGRSVLPVLQPVYQSAHVVWNIDLSERKTSFFLEVLKLQTVKKPVELRGWSDEESEVRSFLQCLPYISQLSGADPYIPSLCKELQSRDQAGQVSPLLQALDFTLSLGGQLSTPSCRAVGRVLGLSASTLNLTLNPQAISLRGVRLLFTHITHLRILSVSGAVVVKMVRTLRTVRSPAPVTVEELSLIHTSTQQPEGALSRVLSSLASLLRLWRVQCLNLTDYKMEAQSLTVLLCHQGHLTIRLSKESLQRLVAMVFEAQEEEFTHCFLQKVGGDLTSCTLTWEVIDYFLQFQSVTVDFRKSDTGQQNPRELLSVLDRLQIRRLSPSCVLSIITEIYQTGSAHCVSSLLSSTENCITLNSRELDSVHCAALCFTLQHCTAVSLSLLFTSIPEGELESIVPLLKHVSHLSVDRLLLLRLLHCCVSELQQGAAVVLLSALQHRLDFSCSSALDLTEDSHTHTLTLSTEDCRVVSVAVQRAHTHTQLTLHDCEIEEAGVEQLFPIIHTVTLQCSKVVLLQFLSLVRVGSELECVRRAVSLSRALGGEVDLSHTRLDQQACGSLALVLEHSEGLSELDLSHCQLTDHCLQLLCPQLHKAHILDLSHNDITDVSAKIIYDTVSINTNIHTVRLFNNRITDRQVFLSDKRFVLRSGDVNVVFVTGRLSDIKWKRSRQVSGKKDGLI
ncbi:uncharacterized protein LOC143523348 isoform X3 [Brachyhypopomus gauderio]|uniref:uncharacterized protein LOC143523348 isoform X3 n=1 Tax=Brachyhypopomus gauderio TaxID=698409 RepID=UPI00404172C8